MALGSAHTDENEIGVSHVEGMGYASISDIALIAKNVGAHRFAGIIDNDTNASSVEDQESANTRKNDFIVRSVLRSTVTTAR